MSACENIYTGIPVPGGNIQWTGGNLLSFDLTSLGCRPKLENVIKELDKGIYDLETSLDLSKVIPGPFAETLNGMQWYEFINLISAWATTIQTTVNSPDYSSLNIGQLSMAIDMSCLMAPGCSTTNFTLLSILETLVSKVCRNTSDIQTIKESIASDLNTANIYIPQT